MSDLHFSSLHDKNDNKDETSFIQKLDPRARVFAAILFAFVTVFSVNLFALVSALFIAMIVVYIAKLSLKRTLKRLAVLDTFMLYLLVFLPFTVPGETFLSFMGFSASWQGLTRAIEITLTANTIVLMLFALVSNLSSSELGSSLQWFKVSPKLIQLLQFTLRYLTVIQEEFNRLRRSMRARAFVMGFNWHTWRTMAYLIGMMLVRSMNRSQRIVNAMKCRGYNGVLINYHLLKWQLRDSIFLMLVAVCCVLIICFNIFLK